MVRLRCARGVSVALRSVHAKWLRFFVKFANAHGAFGFTVRLNGAERHRLERSAEPDGGPPGGGIKAERDLTPTCRGRRAFKT